MSRRSDTSKPSSGNPAGRYGKPVKSRPNPLDEADITYIDYKDTDLLRRFLSDRGKIRSRRVTRVSAQQQRRLARAIKNAREMGLLPYASR
ncbi:30S ribosomal protein S18 [Streptomyces boluensis]|uniref:Small ribosomal subunit protein bS18 n=1 Tax=Streptomyces boluensis TaxID=1775135 RepID=A0A964UL76_9ACTN|nr:30S ribosomal protein S18 [Streptomyces boluensis]NBE51254.1 30S ribosomal protein S18 [Streptomyces boluensis]